MKLTLNKNLIDQGDTVAIALSGGQDSMALLHALIQLKNEISFTLKAINVEHGIRGESSIADSKFCIEQAKYYNIEIRSISVDAIAYSKLNGFTLEQGARVLRYKAFNQAISDGFCNKVATAHHKSDCFETVLLNMFRGSGANGISGIKQINGNIIRPLLNTTKQEIVQYVDYHNILYVQDQTNFDTDYSRNYIRQIIIPKILAKFPTADSSTLRMSESIAKDDELLYQIANNYIVKKKDNTMILNCDKQPLFARASIIAMKHLGINKDYSSAHINALFELQNSETGKQINLLNNVVAIKEYDHISLYSKTNITNDLVLCWEAQNFVFEPYNISVQEVSREFYSKYNKLSYNSNNRQFITIFADAEKLENSIVRPMRQGDIFTKIGGGSKSLKKHLTDKKLSKTTRTNFPILARGNDVLLIFGIETSFNASIDEFTKHILQIEIN